MSPAIWFANAALLGDIGTEEGEDHVHHVHALHQLLVKKGYRQGETLMYVEEDCASHDEEAWARRLRTALYFLLPPTA